MTGDQSFALPPGKMLISLFFATGLVIMSLPAVVAFDPVPEAMSRLYVSKGASLGPLPGRLADGLPATFGFGFGLLAEGVTGGVFATLGFGLGLLPAGAADGFADGAGATFCDMRTSSIMDCGQKNQPVVGVTGKNLRLQIQVTVQEAILKQFQSVQHRQDGCKTACDGDFYPESSGIT